MFQTHYAKQRPRQRWEGDKGPLLTQLESLLYSLAPDDVLFVKETIYTEFKNNRGFMQEGIFQGDTW
jgi:hypothetical protein